MAFGEKRTDMVVGDWEEMDYEGRISSLSMCVLCVGGVVVGSMAVRSVCVFVC